MITIIDVAKAAGVSKSTVSLVLNKSPHVRYETRIKVEKAIKDLGYVRDNNACGLRKNKTNCLGVIVAIESKKIQTYEYNYETGLFSYNITNGIPDGLVDTEYGLITERYCLAESGGELPQIVKKARIDGAFLVGGLFSGEFIQRIQAYRIPVVGVGMHYKSIDCVYIDVANAMYVETKELLTNNCRKIALINCPKSYNSSQDRIKGWKKAISEFKDNIDCTWDIYCHTNTGEGGYLAMKELWESGARPEGIATPNEPTALGVMRFLMEMGVRIPDDVCVVSYEASVLGGYCTPPLTSLNIHKEMMGCIAAKMLIKRIDCPDAPLERHKIKPEMIMRASVRNRNIP